MVDAAKPNSPAFRMKKASAGYVGVILWEKSGTSGKCVGMSLGKATAQLDCSK